MTTNESSKNVELHIKMKKDTITVNTTLEQYGNEGFFIGEDYYSSDEFDYSEEEERLYSKDGRLQIQL